ncbi:MAG: trehalose-phosphatase [Thermoanaerobaculia bacterium]|nr:trehalose-phosphatase [Thermoanaerobaculia bacterium]
MALPAPPLPVDDEDWALFLDVDGTLLEIVETPGEVFVPSAVRSVLQRLLPSLEGALALVSGRSLATLDRLFEPLRLPSAGLHGLERRDAAGAVHRQEVPRGKLEAAREALGEFVERTPGALLEDKGDALALHFRRSPGAAPAAKRQAEELVTALGEPLHVQNGKMVVEIKSQAACKGRSIAAFSREPPFAGRRPVFVGDDVTDEDGFEAVNALGGVSVRVGDLDATAAHYHLESVGALRRWLERLEEALRRRGPGRDTASERAGA